MEEIFVILGLVVFGYVMGSLVGAAITRFLEWCVDDRKLRPIYGWWLLIGEPEIKGMWRLWPVAQIRVGMLNHSVLSASNWAIPDVIKDDGKFTLLTKWLSGDKTDQNRRVVIAIKIPHSINLGSPENYMSCGLGTPPGLHLVMHEVAKHYDPVIRTTCTKGPEEQKGV